MILGSYAAYVLNNGYGSTRSWPACCFTPVFYVLGAAVYRIYYCSFERRGEESLRGLVFFFGILFIIEVSLSLNFGVDYRLVAGPATSAARSSSAASASRSAIWCRAWSASP